MGTILAGLAGLAAGVVLCGVAVLVLMPRLMIVARPSRLSFEATIEAIQKAIPEHGWSSPFSLDINQSLAKRGVEFKPRVRTVQLCNPHHARSVLTTDRPLACLMPCSFAVYEDDQGRVWVSKMNTGLMGRMFGGNVAKVMGGDVSRDEAAILKNVLEG
jgi:uncharacterized protein (DUF302 family)